MVIATMNNTNTINPFFVRVTESFFEFAIYISPPSRSSFQSAKREELELLKPAAKTPREPCTNSTEKANGKFRRAHIYITFKYLPMSISYNNSFLDLRKKYPTVPKVIIGESHAGI
ncbi:MAG: hypothetical protein HW400_59 [Candidatus Levybacteria bacterium]|nr:hypothetical protein [Candidatus Levybacteria bacterium]